MVFCRDGTAAKTDPMILALLGRELRELCLRSEVPSCGRGFSFGETEKRDSNHVRTCRRHVREPVRTPVNTFIFRTAWFLFQVRRPLRKMQANPFFSATSSQAAYRLRRLFMLRIKSHLALISLLLLSKSNPLRWASIWGQHLWCKGYTCRKPSTFVDGFLHGGGKFAFSI